MNILTHFSITDLCNETRLQHIPPFFTNSIIYHAFHRSPKIWRVLGWLYCPTVKKEQLTAQGLEFDKSLLGTHAIPFGLNGYT